jgi:integral membrane protein
MTSPTAAAQRGSTPPRLKLAMTFYRIMAWVTGVALLGLCLAMILHYGFGAWDNGIAIVAPIHGYLYIVYLVSVVYLGLIKQRWPLTRVVLVMLAGTIPVMSFIFERYVTHHIAEWAAAEPARAARVA